jgi:hypothetical protein
LRFLFQQQQTYAHPIPEVFSRRVQPPKLDLKRTTLIHKMQEVGIFRPSRQSRDEMSAAQQETVLLPQLD